MYFLPLPSLHGPRSLSRELPSKVLTSTTDIFGTGLKKCSPPNFSFLFSSEPMSRSLSDEVFVARIAFLKVQGFFRKAP